MKRNLAAIITFATASLVAGGLYYFSRPVYHLEFVPNVITANGPRNSTKVILHERHFFKNKTINPSFYDLKVVDSEKQFLQITRQENGYLVSANGITGTYSIEATWGNGSITGPIFVVSPYKDSDNDGYPDVAELTNEVDRQAFSHWFGAIAESQYQKISADFYPKNQDCAGLIRYAYTQALVRHDAAWLKQHHIRMRLIGPDVQAFHYPDIPEIGANVFLQGEGANPFGPFADARTLLEHNCKFIGFDKQNARTGDLLFYAQRGEDGLDIWHSMIYLAPEQFDEAFVVYHTGPVGTNVPNGTGEVRKVLYSELMNHPDSSWHPVKNNQNFKGFYRFKIVD